MKCMICFKKPSVKKITAFFTIFILQAVLAYSAVNSDRRFRTVKVGFISDSFDFMSTNEYPEQKYGYAYEYLQKIGTFTGWKYEYVYGDFNYLYQQLKKGLIDILPACVKDLDVDNTLLYPKYSMATKSYYIYKTKSNHNIYFDDVQSLEGKTIGVMNNSHHSILLEEWLKKNDVRCNVIYFDAEKIRKSYFYELKIDAVVESDIIAAPDMEPVLCIGKTDIHVGINPDKPWIQTGINDALSYVYRQEPYYNVSLWSKYYSDRNYSYELERPELKWIAANPKICIGCLEDDYPYCYYDYKTNKPRGIIVDIFSNTAGGGPSSPVEVEFQFFKDYQSMMQALEDNIVDAAFPVMFNYALAETQNVLLTSPIDKVPMTFMYKNSQVLNSLDTARIAMSFVHIAPYYAYTYYPNVNINLVNSREACLFSVLAGHTDGAVMNTYQAEKLVRRNNKFKKLKLLQVPYKCEIAIGVKREMQPLVIILNHIIADFTESDKNNSISEHTAYNLKYTLMDFISDYIEIVIAIVIIVFILVVLLIITIDRLYGYINYDALTRLLNRRSLNANLKSEQKSADDGKSDFSVLLVDIDDFKAVNDMYGHTCGDEVLKMIAKTMLRGVNNNDTVYRWGGEEILVLVHGKPSVVLRVAERLRREVEKQIVVYKDSEIHVTVTIGVANYEKGIQLADLFEQADRNLYIGKRNGKNMVVS